MVQKKDRRIASNPVGRPHTFGAAQLGHFNSRQPHYDAKRDAEASQLEMGEFLDDELSLFFAIFGWVDPARSTPPQEVVTDALIDQRKEEAAQAVKNVESGNASETDTQRDMLVTHMRLVCGRFRLTVLFILYSYTA